ncbi:MAG TPA: hypothetical protein VM204_01870, partial [Gaiellaceae bacterium]|nr:hypothetical protein [Gaiellaceae bacterium]
SIADDPGPLPTGEGAGAAEPAVSRVEDSSVAGGCQSHRDCAEAQSDASSGPAVCVKATGACASLLTAECPRFVGDPTNDEAIVLGALLGDGEGSADAALEAAAFLAAEEINAASAGGGLPSASPGGSARPLVVVGCSRAPDVLRGARHLVDDLRVPAIVGPTAGEDVVAATQQVSAKGGTLIMTPTSAVSAISDLADNGLTWRAVPSDAQRAKLVIEQIKALETLLGATRGLGTVKLGVVRSADARGASADDAIRGKLILNGRFITDPANALNVSVDLYPPGDGAALAGIAAKYADTFRPDVVFVTAEEQIGAFVVPFEQALTAARAVHRPYYVVTEAAKTDALLAAIGSTSLPSDARRRIRGVAPRPDAPSAPVLSAFTDAYRERNGALPPASVLPAAALSYDATYAIAYAIAATADQPLSGASVAAGLRTLGVGESAAVGAQGARGVIQALEVHKSVSLRGTFSPLQWDPSGDIAAGTVEVWCVGSSDGAPAFGSSGLTMDVRTQVVGGAFVQCQ